MRRWHAQSAQSGGLIVHKACHDLDIICWLLDARPRTVSSFGGGRPEQASDAAADWPLQNLQSGERTRCDGTTMFDRRCIAFRPIEHSSLVMAGLVDRDLLLTRVCGTRRCRRLSQCWWLLPMLMLVLLRLWLLLLVLLMVPLMVPLMLLLPRFLAAVSVSTHGQHCSSPTCRQIAVYLP